MNFFKKLFSKNKEIHTENDNSDNSDLIILYTTIDEYTTLSIEGILRDNNIAYVIKNHGAGGVLKIATGSASSTETDIYVNKCDYENAYNLISVLFENKNNSK